MSNQRHNCWKTWQFCHSKVVCWLKSLRIVKSRQLTSVYNSSSLSSSWALHLLPTLLGLAIMQTSFTKTSSFTFLLTLCRRCQRAEMSVWSCQKTVRVVKPSFPFMLLFGFVFVMGEGAACTWDLKEGDCLASAPFPSAESVLQTAYLLRMNLCSVFPGRKQSASGSSGKEVASRVCKRVCWLVMSLLPPNFSWPKIICEYKEIV